MPKSFPWGTAAGTGEGIPSTGPAPAAFRNWLLMISLVLVSSAAWIYTVWMAKMPMGPSLPPLPLYLISWVVMMVAMMLPAITPMVLLFSSVTRRRRGGLAARITTVLFISGYLLVWGSLGLIAFLSDVLLPQTAGRLPLFADYTGIWKGSVFILAGLYQITPIKETCLAHCRTPFHFMMHGWREGYAGAVRMGLHHGLYCLGCCWGLMVVLYAVGLMNLAAMTLLALMIFIEKVFSWGPLFAKVTAAILIVFGLLLSTQVLSF